MNNDEILKNQDLSKIILTNDDGEDEEFYITDKATVSDIDYYLILDNQIIEEASQMLILKMVLDDDDEITLELLKDEDELEKVVATFKKQLPDIKFDI